MAEIENILSPLRSSANASSGASQDMSRDVIEPVVARPHFFPQEEPAT